MSIVVHLRGVSERDVDLLLAEELSASHDFRSWFAKAVGLNLECELKEISRSVFSSTGESDLELLYESHDSVTKILVENKIDALLQPRQPERYLERGKAYIEGGSCTRVSTVLVAPDSYSEGSHGFHARISYESLREWFNNRIPDDSRARYKVELLDGAIERGRRGWTPVPDQAVSDFWMKYWRIVSDAAPQLRMPQPGAKPATSGFIRFRPLSLRAGVELLHKAPYGNVDLQFAGMAARATEFAAEHGKSLEPGMHIERANKSLVVRMIVPPITLESPFDTSEATIREAINAAMRLLGWYERHVATSPPG